MPRQCRWTVEVSSDVHDLGAVEYMELAADKVRGLATAVMGLRAPRGHWVGEWLIYQIEGVLIFRNLSTYFVFTFNYG